MKMLNTGTHYAAKIIPFKMRSARVIGESFDSTKANQYKLDLCNLIDTITNMIKGQRRVVEVYPFKVSYPRFINDVHLAQFRMLSV